MKKIRTFWSYKFTSEKNYKNHIWKWIKKKFKFYDTEIEEYKFHQYKNPISINDINIIKIVASNKFPFGKQDFRFLLVTMIIKKLDFTDILFRKEYIWKIFW